MQDEHICTLRKELTSGHTHPEGYTAASKQWGMNGESSSPVIATFLHHYVTSLNCTQSARSGQAWEIDGEYTVMNGYCCPVLNLPLKWLRQS